MNVKLLRSWLGIVEAGSFTSAAERFSISQPALSNQIRSLERELGGELLERTRNGVKLTLAGRALLPEAQAAVASAERAGRTAREALSLARGVLEIATVPSISAAPLLPALRLWQQRYPDVRIRLREFMNRPSLEEAVAGGVADLAIGPRPQQWEGPVKVCGWQAFAAVLPQGDPLLEKESILLAALRDREWVMYDSQSGLSELLLISCARAGFRPIIALESTLTDTIAHLAASGLGVALVPAQNIPAELDEATVSLRHPPAWRVAAYARGDWPPAARAFLDLMAADDFMPRPGQAHVLDG
ncbi:MAG: LysR family transcriptional regulator [Actinobacteria bacterium]|nr:LysR family transcriptional regulator [Actinomycetota bacterium]